MENFFRKAKEKIRTFGEGLFKRGGQPTPTPTPPPRAGYKYVEGTNIQAPFSSELHPENRAGAVDRSLFKENVPKETASITPQPSPTPFEKMFKVGRIPAIATMKISDRVTNAIENAARTYNVPSELLYDVAFAESSLDPNKRNPKGSDTGLYQFTDETWETVKNYAQMKGSSLKLSNFDRYNPETSALAAAYLIKFGQLGRWDASKWNWGQHYKEDEIEPYYSQTLSHKQ